jgi:peptidyl-tRNA hydrolase
VKVGIGRPEHKRHVPDHVLSGFEPEEETVVNEAVERAADRVQELLSR